MPRKVAADSWSGSGSTTSQWMVFDSLSNEVIAVAEDHFEKSVIGFLFCYSCTVVFHVFPFNKIFQSEIIK
jgi:hypothetical protein